MPGTFFGGKKGTWHLFLPFGSLGMHAVYGLIGLTLLFFVSVVAFSGGISDSVGSAFALGGVAVGGGLLCIASAIVEAAQLKQTGNGRQNQ